MSNIRCHLTLLSRPRRWDILPAVTPMWWFQSRHVSRNTPRYLYWLILSSSCPLTVTDGYITLCSLFWVPKRVHLVLFTLRCNFHDKVLDFVSLDNYKTNSQSFQLYWSLDHYKTALDGVSVILEGLFATRGPRTWSPGPPIENIGPHTW